MRMEATQTLRMSQEMRMAPRMIQSMEILQMPIMDLQERIQQELDENPVLELKEPSDEAPAEEFDVEQAAPVEERDAGAKELVIDESSSNEADFDRLDQLSRDWDDHFNEEHRP